MNDWVTLVAGIVGVLVVTWLVFLAVLATTRPDSQTITESLRLVPDTARLVKRLAADRKVRGVRVRLLFLLAYLASPIDLVPDFIPVLGYADDLLLIALVLRSVARTAGIETLRRHWPGTPEGFDALIRLCRVEVTAPSVDAPTAGDDEGVV